MRLIDADKLDDTIIRLNEEDWQITRYEYKRIEGVIFEMPTVKSVPIPDNATNGDVLKAFFSNINRDYDVKHKMGQILFTHEWWNMPYEGSDTE